MKTSEQHMSWKCRLGFHLWSNWGPKFRLPNVVYATEYQQKTCHRCGIVHERAV